MSMLRSFAQLSNAIHVPSGEISPPTGRNDRSFTSDNAHARGDADRQEHQRHDSDDAWMAAKERHEHHALDCAGEIGLIIGSVGAKAMEN